MCDSESIGFVVSVSRGIPFGQSGKPVSFAAKSLDPRLRGDDGICLYVSQFSIIEASL